VSTITYEGSLKATKLFLDAITLVYPINADLL